MNYELTDSQSHVNTVEIVFLEMSCLLVVEHAVNVINIPSQENYFTLEIVIMNIS